MLRSRIIPCLLVRRNGLVKTLQFGEGKYVGDPINAVRIFNEKKVDELSVLDIDATVEGREPNYEMIRNLATESRMPLAYGGGITTPEQASKIITLGVEKVSISAAAIANPGLIREIADAVGTQSTTVVLDVMKTGGLFKSGQYLVTHNATRKTKLDPVEFAQQAEELGAGEIILNSVDRDGMMAGYDIDLAKRLRAATTIPLTILGGAGNIDHMRELIDALGVVGAAAGSLFVFKGPYKAVLINYARPDNAAPR